MSAVGLICRTCWSVHPLSGKHWMSECPDPTMHPGLIENEVAETLEESFHASLDYVEPSEVLGKVREAAIKCALPYWPEAQGLNSREYGTGIGERTRLGWQRMGWRTQVTLEGEFWGVPFRGRLDACVVSDGVRYIADDKSVAESNMYFEKGSRLVKKEQSAQVGIYGHMEPIQTCPMPPLDEEDIKWAEAELAFIEEWKAATETEGLIWVGAQTRAFDKKAGQYIDPWLRKRTEPMTLDDIGALRPAGALGTVRQNAEVLWKFKQRVKAAPLEQRHAVAIEALKEVEMWCASMYGGACKLYCDANRTCLRLAGVRLATKGIVEVAIPYAEYGI